MGSQNAGGGFHGTVTLRTALSRSYNIPAIRVALRVGTDKVMRMAKACGITSLVEDGPYTDNNPAMALGGLTKGVSPLEMAVAYGTIANNGVLNQPVAITKIVDRNGKIIFEHKHAPKQVVSAKAAYQTTDMLKDVLISGTAGGSGLGRPAAGKPVPPMIPKMPGSAVTLQTFPVQSGLAMTETAVWELCTVPAPR